MRAFPAAAFLGSGVALVALSWGCEAGTVGDRVALEVAPLGVPGLSEARYTVIVRAGGPDGELVWAGGVASERAGAVASAVPCDATAEVNAVTLVLDALYDDHGALIDPDRYENPTPLSVSASCGGDARAAFDVTVSRHLRADVLGESATFGAISCAARVQCERASDGAELKLLANPSRGGAPDTTAVLELACSGAEGVATRLYLDDPVIRCEGLAEPIVVDAGGRGLVDLGAPPSANADGYLFAAAVNRQVEVRAGVARWTVALGLDAAAFADAGRCRLTARASASDRVLTMAAAGWQLPDEIVYPVISWDVALSDAHGRVCRNHEMSPGAGIDVRYAGVGGAPSVFVWGAEPVCFCHRYSPADGSVSSLAP